MITPELIDRMVADAAAMAVVSITSAPTSKPNTRT